MCGLYEKEKMRSQIENNNNKKKNPAKRGDFRYSI